MWAASGRSSPIWLGNAIKFTESGHVLIEVTGAVSSSDMLDLAIHVHDTGMGIPADKLEAVFEKFSQVDTSSTRSARGDRPRAGHHFPAGRSDGRPDPR
ncbi:ATP-binding protein [Hoeflea alexandrii]|uniref:ATP-binding protein n=1 Tax=Hoeflea alexandrii TaxID=288436 RepID=UPI0022711F83|nr:ATP-binding protein [Hoeflea alexandrii]MCY0152553.1 ATP-binding protein [Hoeflea alexandrii]